MTSLIKKLSSMIVNNKYHLDDILYILRPFVYVYSVMKYGKKSYKPIKIAFIIDAVSILLSLNRLRKSMSRKSKNDDENEQRLKSIEKQ